MNKTENSPLHTILKINKFSNLTQRNSSFLNKFPKESDMKNLLKRSHYDTVFSKIMYYFNKSTFYNEVFLPRMDKRTKFMRMNRKFTPLTQEQFEEQKEILQINNTYDGYSSRQEIPLFTYITNDPDQFENWSAIKIFEWWRSLRMSGIQKKEWPIFDAVKYLFINQFMRIMNSYLKYGVDKRDKLASDELLEYLRLVDVFYTNGGQYKHLLNAHLAFCEWFSARFIGGLLFESGRNNNEEYVSSSIYSNKKNSGSIYTIEHAVLLIKEFFEETLKNDNAILFIPLSFFQKESKFINTYTGPFIVFLGVNYRTHSNSRRFQDNYSPFNQIIHDLIHSKSCKSSYDQLYQRTDYNDIELFEQRCKFLTIVSSINNDNCKKLLWLILHEISFFEKYIEEIFIRTIIESNTFFNFNILFERLNNIENYGIGLLKKYLIIESEDSEKLKLDAIYTLICVCIVFFMSNFLPLEYFQNLKIFVEESIIIINNPNNISFNKRIKILRDDNILIEFKYNIQTKQFELLYLSDYKLLEGILNLQSKRISLIHNPSCFESYLLSPNTIKACEILSGCLFFNNEFLPKMRDRVAKKRVIMRVNKKFSKLSESNFRTKQSELGMKTNSFNKYQERYDTPLFTYITNDPDQFENWSAIRIFEWWRNLRMSGTQFSTFQKIIPKREWPIFDSVKYLFINQILHILNSYRKYGISDGSHWAFNELQEYLQLVDSFYNSQGQYQYLLNAHLAFCEWFSVRFIGGLLFERRKGNYYVNSREYKNYSENIILLQESATNKLKKIFEKSLIDKNYILFIPLSISQKESKFINIYSSPIISYLGTNYRTHENGTMYYLHYSPIHQITHDIYIHAKQIIENYSSLYPTENYNDVALFAKRCKFLTIVSFIENENAIILLFNILHETYFFKESSNNFFDLNILFNKLNDNKKIYDTILRRVNKSILDNGIYTLICACIIFFMCNFLLLNDIQKIAITINDLITTVSFNEEQLIQLQINTKDKKIVLLYVKPEIDKRYIQSLNFNVNRLGYRIVDSEQNKINKLSSNIGNLLAKLNEQNKTTLMKKQIINYYRQAQQKL